MISGPPCPPVSSIGQRLGEEDCRSEVFYVCLRWIVHRARRSSRFSFWVLENPTGIEKRRRQDDQSFAAKVVRLMELELPEGWKVHTQRLNLSESGLPAQRPRFFIIGTGEKMRASAVQRRLLAAPPRHIPPIPLAELLSPCPPSNDYENISANQQVNVLIYLEHFNKHSAVEFKYMNNSSESQRK